MTAKDKVIITALAIATQLTGLTTGVYARDFGQYNDVPRQSYRRILVTDEVRRRLEPAI